MARFARVVVVDVAHHVTQRGNARQVILSSDSDRVAYLELLRHHSELYGLTLLGYCLMSNHVAGGPAFDLVGVHKEEGAPSSRSWRGRVRCCGE